MKLHRSKQLVSASTYGKKAKSNNCLTSFLRKLKVFSPKKGNRHVGRETIESDHHSQTSDPQSSISQQPIHRGLQQETAPNESGPHQSTPPITEPANADQPSAKNNLTLCLADETNPYTAESDYFIQEVLGEGSFGKVYAATCSSAKNARLAIKIQDMAVNRVRATALRREIAVMEKHGHHTNINSVYASFVRGTDYWMVMPRATMDLGTLLRFTDVVEKQPNVLQRAMRGILSGLQHLHRQGVAHLDLKPENILVFTTALDENNDLLPWQQIEASDFCIADFGKARCSTDSNTGIVRVKRGGGTFIYRAPELALGVCEDARCCDLFSLGVLLHRYTIPSSNSIFEWCEHMDEGNRMKLARYVDALREKVSATQARQLQRRLMVDLLTIEPSWRPTATEALQHPWFQHKYGDAQDN